MGTEITVIICQVQPLLWRFRRSDRVPRPELSPYVNIPGSPSLRLWFTVDPCAAVGEGCATLQSDGVTCATCVYTLDIALPVSGTNECLCLSPYTDIDPSSAYDGLNCQRMFRATPVPVAVNAVCVCRRLSDMCNGSAMDLCVGDRVVRHSCRD